MSPIDKRGGDRLENYWGKVEKIEKLDNDEKVGE